MRRRRSGRRVRSFVKAVCLNQSHLRQWINRIWWGARKVSIDTLTFAVERLVTSNMITTLSLENNYIGDDGAAAIAGALGSSKLESLNLMTNKIGDVGAIAIAKALEAWKNSSLASLKYIARLVTFLVLCCVSACAGF